MEIQHQAELVEDGARHCMGVVRKEHGIARLIVQAYDQSECGPMAVQFRQGATRAAHAGGRPVVGGRIG